MPTPRRKIIIHAGFHKTGTTSAQRFLIHNGKHIYPHAAIVIQRRIERPLEMAMAYSTGGGDLALNAFRQRFATFLESLDPGRRGLVISAENLAGMMPGKGGMVDGYGACPALMHATLESIHQALGPHNEIVFYFSTRAKPAWRHSLWWHGLWKARLRDDFTTFSARLGPNCNLHEVVARVRAKVAPCRVVSRRLEALAQDRFGPATALVDLLGLPLRTRRALENVPPQHAMPSPDLAPRFLALNRSALPNAEVAARKRNLIEAARAKTARKSGVAR